MTLSGGVEVVFQQDQLMFSERGREGGQRGVVTEVEKIRTSSF
jgi:hypothetical protein